MVAFDTDLALLGFFEAKLTQVHPRSLQRRKVDTLNPLQAPNLLPEYPPEKFIEASSRFVAKTQSETTFQTRLPSILC